MAVPGEDVSEYSYTSFNRIISITGSNALTYPQFIPTVETTTIAGSFIFRDKQNSNDVEKVINSKVLDLERRLIYIVDDLGKVGSIEQIT